MGLMESAYMTYRNLEKFAGEKVESGYLMLAPVYHVYKKWDIYITVDMDGNFVSAGQVDTDTNNKVVVPVNSVHNNNPKYTPYVLCTDYGVIANPDTEKSKNYLQYLKEWSESGYSHPAVKAVYRYVTKGTVAEDLKGIKDIKPKHFVVWRVIDKDGVIDVCYEKSLFESHIGWMRELLKNGKTDLSYGKGLCYVTGEEDFLMKKHPQGTIPVFITAKLLSAADKSDFTFRGRFRDETEAFGVSCEASWAVHNILVWLASNGSVMVYNKKMKFARKSLYGNRVLLCWNPDGKVIPRTIEDVCSDSVNNESEWDTVTDDGISKVVDEYKAYTLKLRNVLKGFKDQFSPLDKIVFAVFTAASKGRISLASYSEVNAWQYFERFEKWYSSLAFYFRRGKEYRVYSPSAYRICLCALGVEQDSKKSFELLDKDRGIFGQFVEQVENAMLHQLQVLKAIMDSLVYRASRLVLYNSKNRETLLWVTCAVIYKHVNFKKEVYSMSLQEDLKDRSYLFGRLLAIMEKVERDVLQEENATREPNAMRLQQYYQNRPFTTANTIHNLISPYLAKINVGKRVWYKNRIGEIFTLLSDFPDGELNRPLKETYLLGYYLQRKELYTKKTNKEEKNHGDGEK